MDLFLVDGLVDVYRLMFLEKCIEILHQKNSICQAAQSSLWSIFKSIHGTGQPEIRQTNAFLKGWKKISRQNEGSEGSRFQFGSLQNIDKLGFALFGS